jgi:tRNA threonylcarbamoyladenosine biosynthesis protein TsaB
MKILAVDTSGKPVSVAAVSGRGLLARFWLEHGKAHSESLMPCIEQMLSWLGLGVQDIDALAAVTGPGSFTGLRIGVSAVKAMAYALGVQAIGVSTLDSLAYNLIGYSHSVICPLIDARNSQAYTALYAAVRQPGAPGGALVRLTEPSIMHIGGIAEEICRWTGDTEGAGIAADAAIGSGTAIRFAEPDMHGSRAHAAHVSPKARQPRVALNGDAAAKHYDFLAQSLEGSGCACELAHERDMLQDAASAALIAYGKASAGLFTPPAALAPEYLRKSQAERLRYGQE